MTDPPGCKHDSHTLLEKSTAYYQDSQVERFLDDLSTREGHAFERTVPDYRHFGTPEYALHLSWDHRQVAGVRIAKVMEIFMGYAGTLLIEGKLVTVLLYRHWQHDRLLVQQALERAYQEPHIKTRLAKSTR